MTNSAEVYFYLDKDFSRSLDSIILPLKNHGHRVLVGRDFDELLLLLEISHPSVVFCAFSHATATREERFQSLSDKALESKIPIVVLGPYDPRDGFTLYAPGTKEYETRHVPFAAILETISGFAASEAETLREKTVSAETETRRPDPEIEPIEPGDWDTDVSILEYEPDEEMESEEELGSEEETDPEGEMDFVPRVENEPAQVNEPIVLPEARVPIPDREDFRGEISGPISLPSGEEPKTSKSEAQMTSSATFQILLGLGALLCAALAIVFAWQPVWELPIEVASKTQMMEPDPQQRSVSASAKRETADGSGTPPGTEEVPWGNRFDAGAGDGRGDFQRVHPQQPVAAEIVTVTNWPKEKLESALPFPGTFRLNTARFWFQEEWEINRFRDMVRNLPADTKIRIIGFVTDKEIKDGQGHLDRSRAWAVERFLLKEGIPLERLSLSRGGKFYRKTDLDSQGHPRNRLVEIVVEPLENQNE